MQSMDPGHLFTAHSPATPLFRRATQFCTHYAPQEHDEDAEQNPFKLCGNVKPVEGRVCGVHPRKRDYTQQELQFGLANTICIWVEI